MATGIPKQSTPLSLGSVRLAYDGKATEEEICNEALVEHSAICSSRSGKRLYFGENLDVLRLLVAESEVCGKINLIYIDPPFATQSRFVSRTQSKAYEDTLVGAAFVEFLRQRIMLLHKLLSDNGSMYLHLDEKMVFEMKLVMDEVFGSQSYRNTIVRKKCNPKNYTRKSYGNIADFILFYTKTDKYVWNKQAIPLSEDSKKEYRYIEEVTGRRFMKVPVHAPGARNGETGKPWKGKKPPLGKHWQYPPAMLDEMDVRGEIFWSKNGNPRRKIYLDTHSGAGVQDIWLDFRDAHNQNIKITGYPTEKNSDLLRRIVATSSHPGDIVLDCFAGSGTTLAVADEMQRKWIGIDNSMEAIKTTLDRFRHGPQRMGNFVENNTQQRKITHLQQTLFNSLDTDAAHAQNNLHSTHKIIMDFSFFASGDVPTELCKALNDQKYRNNGA